MVRSVGIVTKRNRTRVVVEWSTGDYAGHSAAIGGDCLAIFEPNNAGIYFGTITKDDPMETSESAAMATIESAVDAALIRRRNAAELRSLNRAEKRNARKDGIAQSANRSDGSMPKDCQYIAKTVANRSGMFGWKEIHDSAASILALAKEGTERNAAYRHLVSGQCGRNDYAVFRSVAMQWASRETRSLRQHESFAIGDDGNVIVSSHGYRPLRDNAPEWMAGIDHDDIVRSAFMPRYIAASLAMYDRAGVMVQWSECHPMATVAKPSLRTVAAAYRADGKSQKSDRDDAGKRAELAGNIFPFMAGKESFGRMPMVNESGNTSTMFGKDGTWKVKEPFGATTRILREQPLESMLANPIFGVLGGAMESRTEKDAETKRNMADWQERFLSAPLPDTKIGKRIMVAMETNRAMLDNVATLAKSMGIPVPSWTRNMPTFGETLGRLIADYYVVQSAKSENVIVDWASLHHDLFGEMNDSNRRTDTAAMQRMVRRMAMQSGGDLCTERCPIGSNHSHGCPNGITGTTVATSDRVRSVGTDRMIPAFMVRTDDGKRAMVKCDPAMAGFRSAMFHAWSDRINGWMADTLAGYRAMVASLKTSANHSADAMERERLALSIEWGISATFRDEHARMVARHSARMAR